MREIDLRPRHLSFIRYTYAIAGFLAFSYPLQQVGVADGQTLQSLLLMWVVAV